MGKSLTMFPSRPLSLHQSKTKCVLNDLIFALISSGPIPTEEDNTRVHVAEEIYNRLTGVAREKRGVIG